MARVFQEGHIHTLYANGLFIPERMIMMDNDSREAEDNTISAMTANRFIKSMNILEAADPDAPILVLVTDCEGGEDGAGYAIYDRIMECACHVTMRCYGQVMSMATIILQAADDRQVTPNVDFMIHDGQSGYEGNPRDVKRWADYDMRTLKRMYEIYLEVMKDKDNSMTLSKVERMCLHDYVFTAQKAVDLGLADSIYRGKNN